VSIPEDRAKRERLGDGLGLPSMTQRGLVEAIARCRDQVRLRPDDAGLYAEYGRLLGDLGRHDKAIEACRNAIKLNPKDGSAHCILGNSLAAQGHLYDALTAFREAQRVEPAQSQSRRWQLRYRAACAAARAAAGKGKDGPPPNDAVKVELRQQALDLLRAEHEAWDHLLESGAPQAGPLIADALQHWKQDSDLAGVRGAIALAELTEDERQQWQTIWADVEALLKRAQGQPSATP
jgi:tetratricopeptide (TPR) repeat protein